MPEFQITDHEIAVLGDDPIAIAVRDELKKVTGKYQSLALAILLLGLPGMKDTTWDEFEGPVDTAARDTLSKKMITLGFSKEFVDSVNGPEDKPVGEKLSGIIAAKDSLQAVRASVFGETRARPFIQSRWGQNPD